MSSFTDNELPTRPFLHLDPRIDEAYVKSVDTLSTINAVILIVVAVVCSFVSFLFTLSEPVQAWLPMLMISVFVLLFVLFVVWHNTRTQYSTMTNVVPAFTVALLVGLLMLFKFAPAEGFWTVPEPSENTALYVAVGLSFALLAVYFMNADLRADLVRFNSGAFAAFVCFSVFLSAGMLYIGSLLDRAIKNWIKHGRLGSYFYHHVYWSLAGAIMLGLLLVDEMTGSLVNMVMGAHGLGNQAASVELANATSRSKQMVVAIYAVLVILPLGLVYWVKDGLLHPPESPRDDFIVPISILAALFPMLVMTGLGLNETRRYFPSAYRLFEILVGGLVFFVAATQFVPWDNKELVLLLALAAFAYSVMSILGRKASPMAVAIPAAALAVAVISGDPPLPFALASAAVAAVWTIYNYRNSASIGAPAALTGFMVASAFGSWLNQQETAKDIGLQMAILVPLLSFATTMARELEGKGLKQIAVSSTFAAGLAASLLRLFLVDELSPYFREKQEQARKAWEKMLPKLS